MASVWGRAWRSRISFFTKHGVKNTRGDDGGSLQPATGGGSTTSGTTNTATTTSTSASGGTTHTTTSHPVRERSFDFHPSTVLPTAPVVEENAEDLGEEERVKKLEHIKGLVVLFCEDNNSALERWLSELDVNWVFYLAHVSGSGRSFISGQLLYLARSWIVALFEITKSISIYFGGCCGSVHGFEFVRFVEATMSKMFPFVDAIVAVRISGRRGATEPADEKLQALILVSDALSTASAQILSSLSSSPCGANVLGKANLLAKLDKGIWDTMEETNTRVKSASLGAQKSPAIHKGTLSVINFINVMWASYGTVNRILHDAFLRGDFVPKDENVGHLKNLTVEMVQSLEEKLTTSSQSFPNPSLKFLFLINNFHFIMRRLRTNCHAGFPMPELAGKIDECVNSYIQVSWAPVLECLRNPTPHRFTRHSPLPRFESIFRHTYTAQELSMIPDPEMRKKLRGAIIEEVIPVFTEFLNDNRDSTPRITPQEMTELLNELFEG